MMNPMNFMGNGMNPMQIIQTLKKSNGNPMAMMESMMGNNPQFQRVMQMVKGKSPSEVRQVAMNLCQQSGIDFDAAVSQMREMGLNLPDDINPPENLK